MIIRLPNIERFVEEANEAGALRVYVGLSIEYRVRSGLGVYWARVVATAVGVAKPHAGGPERVLLRYQRDFGPAYEDPAARAVPREYREKVDRFAGELRARLAGAGFEVREGVIAAL